MQKSFCVGCFVLFAAMAVAAQKNTPKAELFGGYQFAYGDGLKLNGWNTSITGNISRSFGITADFAGVYNGGHVYSYMFGPVVSARGRHVTPFLHALFGGATGAGPAGGS